MTHQFIEYLCSKKHLVEIGDSADTREDIIDGLKNGFLHITFPDTRGQTRLLLEIDQELLNSNVFDLEQDKLLLEGKLGLNFEDITIKVECSLEEKNGEAQVFKSR